MMQDWPDVSKTRVSFMEGGDFYGSEKALTLTESGTASIEFVAADGNVTSLKSGIALMAGRNHRLRRDEREGVARFLCQGNRKGQSRQRASLTPRQDDHDACLRPDHIRSSHFGVL